jgi:hypothetical protein
MGPILLGVIWQETFTPVGAPAADLKRLVVQHGEIMISGLAPRAGGHP